MGRLVIGIDTPAMGRNLWLWNPKNNYGNRHHKSVPYKKMKRSPEIFHGNSYHKI